MDASHLAHLLRRSRSRSFAAGPGHVNIEVRSPNDSSGIILEKKAAGEYGHVTAPSGVATRTVGQAVQVTTQRQAAQAATIGTTRNPLAIAASRSAENAESAKSTLALSSAKSTLPATSSATPSSTSSAAAPSSTSSSTSTATSTSTSTSTTPSTTSTRTSTSTTPSTTHTSTSTSSAARALTSTNTSSALPSSTLTAANAKSSSSGMGTGAIIGTALGAIVGLVVVGSLIGWLYRKYTARSYSSKSPWAKIDDDITPFPPPNEKYSDQPADDIYGGAAAPVIGSRRALAMARENAFDNSLRPDSEMYERDSNHAGFGAGAMAANNSAYPQILPSFGYDAQGRPYNPQAGATPMTYGYEDQYSPYYDVSPQGDSRQLVGPNSHPYAVSMPTPVPMGRPTAPSTAAEFALAEDFADEPLTPGLAYTVDEPITPVSQIAPVGGPRIEGRSRVSMTPQAPRIMSPTESLIVHDTIPTPPLAAPAPVATASSLNTPSHIPLPAFAPLSPLMDDFSFKRQSQPLAMYEDEKTTQKRMYHEVATTAGIDEPTTPYSAGRPSPNPQNLNESTASTTSSFSAPQADSSILSNSGSMGRLPELMLEPPEPYMHGQPLSPLKEVPTPLSTASTGEPLLNPFDLPLPSRNLNSSSSLAPPYTASSTGATTGYSSPIPSVNYPPPSPGGMSVPGSVTDSPRWTGNGGQNTPKGRAVSVYQEEDAYGGI